MDQRLKMTNMPINIFLGATCVSVFSRSATLLSKKLWEVCILNGVTNNCYNIRLNVSFIYSFGGVGRRVCILNILAINIPLCQDKWLKQWI